MSLLVPMLTRKQQHILTRDERRTRKRSRLQSCLFWTKKTWSATTLQRSHAKATAHLDARRTSHKKALETAVMLVLDEEDLERDDLAAEWEEFFQLQVLDPYYGRRIANLGMDEAKARREIELYFIREFERSSSRLSKYLEMVEPFSEMHRLDCEELLKHSSSAIELLTMGAMQRVFLESSETTSRVDLTKLQSDVWARILEDGERFHSLVKTHIVVFRSFHLEKSLCATVETETVRRAIIHDKQGQERLELLDRQQTDVESAASFREWLDVTEELYDIERQHRRFLFAIHQHAFLENVLVQQELAARRKTTEFENDARALLFRVEAHIGRFVDQYDDMLVYAKREFQAVKTDILHRSAEFKTLPAEIQEVARRVREGDESLTSFIVKDAAAYTGADFARLLDFLKQSRVPLQKIS
ncbi:Hypothetical protein, putative, partial [Bodo saltans]